MRVIKYGSPRQLLYFTCHTCGCQFEMYNEEIWQNIDDKEIRIRCPSCGIYLYDLRDKIQVIDGCLGNRCARLTCDKCKWES